MSRRRVTQSGAPGRSVAPPERERFSARPVHDLVKGRQQYPTVANGRRRAKADAKVGNDAGVFSRVSRNPNNDGPFSLNCHRANNLAFSDSCVPFRPRASLSGSSWRNDTRNDTRREPLRSSLRLKTSRKPSDKIVRSPPRR